MERLAIISDIHGNLPALEAVLSDIEGRGLRRVICLGDLAGKGPNSAEAVDSVAARCEAVVQGNWDYALAAYDSALTRWHRAQLGEKRLGYLGSLPRYLEFILSGRLVRLCHASPDDLFFRTFPHTETEKRLKLFAPTETLDRTSDVVGYGDIHMAYIEPVSGRTLFNAGSVGNPLDITQASYAILEGVYGQTEYAALTISLVRVPYDIERAVADAQKSDMPEKDAYIKELRTAVYRGLSTEHKEEQASTEL
jgi:predicted phosphodiesterase